jgi:hypothetical protein
MAKACEEVGNELISNAVSVSTLPRRNGKKKKNTSMNAKAPNATQPNNQNTVDLTKDTT